MTSSLQVRSAMELTLDEQHRRLLKQGLQLLDENRRIVTVDHTMIEARREIHHLPRNELSAIPYGSNSHLVDADDGDLRMIDDRCRRDRAQRTERGDGDGGASQLAAIGSGISRILGKSCDFACVVPQGIGLSMSDNRHHEAARRL